MNLLSLFVTMRCNNNCPYCIQKGADRSDYKEVSVDKWINYFNELQSDIEYISLIGGEPSVYPGFKEFIEALHEKYFITVTTNLSSKFYSNFDAFLQWAKNYRVRWNMSFHPTQMDVKEFINRILRMRLSGLYVDQVAGVDVPETRSYLQELCNAHIGFCLQVPTYLDEKGVLHPTKNELSKFGSGETLIHDTKRYNYLCGGKKDDIVICHTNKLLVDPSGNIFRCHRDLYAKENSIGNVLSNENNINMICTNVGTCNMCDASDIRYWVV